MRKQGESREGRIAEGHEQEKNKDKRNQRETSLRHRPQTSVIRSGSGAKTHDFRKDAERERKRRGKNNTLFLAFQRGGTRNRIKYRQVNCDEKV